MPMNAPVMETTGTDLVPTSYICGRTFLRLFQRTKVGPTFLKVLQTKIQKSPKAAMMLVVLRPTCSMNVTGMAGHHKGWEGYVVVQAFSLHRLQTESLHYNWYSAP